MPSSVVANISYDASDAILRIRFISGMLYEYLNVPESIYLAMKQATSKGIFLNKHIKGNYAFRKVRKSH